MISSIKVDTHTHTTLSGHAWSTLRENAVAAARLGLYGICLTEHGPTMPGSGPDILVGAQKMLPDFVAGVRVFKGIEANIVDENGGLDIDDWRLPNTEFCIASLHDLTIAKGTPERNTRALINALRKPLVDIVAHIDDGNMPSDLEAVVTEAGRNGKLIEINNNSLRMRKGSVERVKIIAGLCARLGVRVSVSSDAHFDEMIGRVEPSLALLAEADFPEELIVNRSAESFLSYLEERKARVPASERDMG